MIVGRTTAKIGSVFYKAATVKFKFTPLPKDRGFCQKKWVFWSKNALKTTKTSFSPFDCFPFFNWLLSYRKTYLLNGALGGRGSEALVEPGLLKGNFFPLRLPDTIKSLAALWIVQTLEFERGDQWAVPSGLDTQLKSFILSPFPVAFPGGSLWIFQLNKWFGTETG